MSKMELMKIEDREDFQELEDDIRQEDQENMRDYQDMSFEGDGPNEDYTHIYNYYDSYPIHVARYYKEQSNSSSDATCPQDLQDFILVRKIRKICKIFFSHIKIGPQDLQDFILVRKIRKIFFSHIKIGPQDLQDFFSHIKIDLQAIFKEEIINNFLK